MARNAIVLRGNPRREGGKASGAITPGMLVEPTGTGESYRAQNTALAGAAPLFADFQHEKDGAGPNDAIASGDSFTVVFAQTGDKINAVTDDTIARGEWVESAGGGKVQPATSGYRIGYAAAASDLSGTVGRVEIIIAPVGVE